MFSTPKRYRSDRSTEAPMDFQFTSRSSNDDKPVWSLTEEELNARKRQRETSEPPAPFAASPGGRTFGANQNIPFIFNTPPPQTPNRPPWAPPPNFSASQAFPQSELNDVDMAEGDSVKMDDTRTPPRPVASGALQRIFKSRQKSQERRRHRKPQPDQDDPEDDSDDEEVDRRITQNTSHHYTLNLPSLPAPQSDLPYVLLGYLQFFFNLSLVLLFLYLLVMVIITVQKDVGQRISEHSMDIVQEIAMCALAYKNNGCADNRVPHMFQPCAEWETCMNRDPTVVGRARVGAEMIGEIVNSFVDSISWKTFLFSLTSLSFLTIFINSLLSLYRSRLMPAAPPPPPHHIPSLGPHAYPASAYDPNLGQYLNAASPAAWSKSRQWSNSEDSMQTPTRRRKLDGGDSLRIK